MNAGPRLDRLPICRFHYRLLAIVGSGLFLDAVDIYIQGPLLAFFLATGWSDIRHNADFLSATFIGLLCGALASGYLSDRFGRRRLYQLNLLLFACSSVVAAFSPSPTMLIACRVVIGLGLGGEVVVSYGTLTEFMPPTRRAIWQGKLALISNLGIPASALLCYILLPRVGWRPVFAVIGIFAFIAWIFRQSMPESPRWYETVNRDSDAEAVLRAIEAEVERDTGAPLPPPLKIESRPAARPAQRMSMFFRAGLRRRMLLAMLLMVCANVTVYAFTAWLPTILLQKHIPVNRMLMMTWIIQIGAIPGALLGPWISERAGRKLGIIGLSIAAALSSLSFAFVATWGALIAAGLVTSLLTYSLCSIMFAVYIPELFPTALRMTGSSFANACGRMANIFAPQGIAWMIPHWGPSSVFSAMSALLVAQAVVVALFGEDTARRSLEEISRIT